VEADLVTAQAETRFKCDRCGNELNQVLQNTPVTARVTAPDDWLTFWLEEIGNRAMHLCPECNTEFVNFMGRDGND
jgi:hypothetical protein